MFFLGGPRNKMGGPGLPRPSHGYAPGDVSDRQRVKKVIIISVTKTMKEKRNRTGEKEMSGAEKKRSTTSYYGGDPWIKEKEYATARCCQVCNRLKSVNTLAAVINCRP